MDDRVQRVPDTASEDSDEDSDIDSQTTIVCHEDMVGLRCLMAEVLDSTDLILKSISRIEQRLKCVEDMCAGADK